MRERYGASVRKALRLAQFSHGGWYPKSQARDQSALRLRIREIAHARPRFGYLRIQVMLRREGWPVNKKRVYRWYRLEACKYGCACVVASTCACIQGLCLGRFARTSAGAWILSTISYFEGRPFRVLTVVDQFSRQTPLLEPRFSFSGHDVVAALDQAIARDAHRYRSPAR
jgi:putative transposase